MGIDAVMILKVVEYTDEQTLELAKRAFELFGHALFIAGVAPFRRHCITRAVRDGETQLHVHLRGRYYGECYERGDLPDYIMLAEFFERSVPGAQVFYGGDCSDALGLFDRTARDKLFDHYVKFGHRPYNEGFDHEKDGPVCSLCKEQMVRYGWGGDNYKAWRCWGCGQRVVCKDGVETYYND